MMFTDDTVQDEWEVLCAKWVVYTHLASRVSKAIFRADGAGCFRSVLQRAVQPMWFFWTGIVEKVNRISPAGAGKSSLDGMFARVGELLHMAVDMGHSYFDAATMFGCNGCWWRFGRHKIYGIPSRSLDALLRAFPEGCTHVCPSHPAAR